jgi:two-component system sensor kinase
VSVARNWPSPIYTTAAKALRRIVLEAVQNARLHGGANRVRITLRVRDDGQAVLTVGDDGRGLSSGWLRGSRGFGVIGMRERAHMLGGRLEITRRRTRGTLVRVTLPMAQLAPA